MITYVAYFTNIQFYKDILPKIGRVVEDVLGVTHRIVELIS